jgi:ribonuclease P protein component
LSLRSLSKNERLLTPSSFKIVYANRQFGGSALFTFNVLGALTNPKVQVTTTRLGVTVSKKVSKRAVDRNRIKRNVKEFYRHHKTDIHQAHLVITAKPASATAGNIELQQSLEELWAKLMKWQRWHSHQLAKKASTDNPESVTK